MNGGRRLETLENLTYAVYCLKDSEASARMLKCPAACVRGLSVRHKTTIFTAIAVAHYNILSLIHI